MRGKWIKSLYMNEKVKFLNLVHTDLIEIAFEDILKSLVHQMMSFFTTPITYITPTILDRPHTHSWSLY